MKFQTSTLVNLLYILIAINFSAVMLPCKAVNILSKGSSLSVEDETHVLTSLDNTFTCGFYTTGTNAYWFSIWFTNSKERTVVWMANRDKPVNGKGSRLFLRRNGVMILTDVDGSTVWETTGTSSGADVAELLDTGNLVLKDPNGTIVWQSFDSPTDTLLPNQLFTRTSRLVSNLGIGNFGTGFFNFFFDNNNVLTLMYGGSDLSTIYVPNPGLNSLAQIGRTNYNRTRLAMFDEIGNFLSSDNWQFSASDKGFGIKRRLTMDIDGNLRIYSLSNGTGLWLVSWMALAKHCDVLGICGENGICVNDPEPKCSCPPGYKVNDPANWTKGCRPVFNQTCNPRQAKFVKVLQTDFYGYDLNTSRNDNTSLETCMQLCLNDCRCKAFAYRLTGERFCYPKGVLFNGFMAPSFPGHMYVKVPLNLEASETYTLDASDTICNSTGFEILIGSPSMYEAVKSNVKWVYLYAFAGAIGGVELLFFALALLLFGINSIPASVEAGYTAILSQFRKFSYTELKKATNNFKDELGRGSSGTVYKGVLPDERVVAVKRLEGSYFQGEDVLMAEVTTIGRINHMNLVTMWGFCSERKHRLLVYEFMENQSLDKHLFSPEHNITWKNRFKVALGTAKGLAYLHHECLEWVIHCDVKPENILVNSDFEPKIADFGLAKLSQRGGNNSEFSRIRGTKGYLAPEWALNHPITAKVDVYSYGVVILELVKGIRLGNWITDSEGERPESELARFVRIVKMKLESGEKSWIDEIVDPRLKGQFNRNQVETIVKIGASCVKEDRNQRPTMDSVVQSLLDCQENQ